MKTLAPGPGRTLDEVAALSPGVIRYARICDAPGSYDASDARLIATARRERLYPGEGDTDLAGLVRAPARRHRPQPRDRASRPRPDPAPSERPATRSLLTTV